MDYEKGKVCCFTGHRSLPEYHMKHILQKLKYEMEKLIFQGVEVFCTGGALGFDSVAASMVIVLKEQFPHIKLVLALPCPDQTKYWKPREIAFYNDMLKEADEVVYISDHYYSGVMHERNRWMVDHSGFCICYLTKKVGGTFYTAEYAKHRGLLIVNIADC